MLDFVLGASLTFNLFLLWSNFRLSKELEVTEGLLDEASALLEEAVASRETPDFLD